MKATKATFLSQGSQNHFRASLFRWVKSTALLIRRPILAWFFGVGVVGVAIEACFEYRILAGFIGGVGAAMIIRGDTIPWRGLLCGTGAFILLPILVSFDEVLYNPAYRLDTIIELGLLTPRGSITESHIYALLVSFLIFLFWRRNQSGRRWPERYTWLTGAFFTDTKRIVAAFRRTTSEKSDDGLEFGTLTIPPSWATKNFLLTGVIGSGKTTYLKKLMASALKKLRAGLDQRALVYDLKAEFYPILLGMALQVPVRVHSVRS